MTIPPRSKRGETKNIINTVIIVIAVVIIKKRRDWQSQTILWSRPNCTWPLAKLLNCKKKTQCTLVSIPAVLYYPYPVYFGTHIRCTLGSMKLELSSNISNPTQRYAADDYGKSWKQCDSRLVSYPTRWSLLFIFGFLYGSIQQRNIVQLCTRYGRAWRWYWSMMPGTSSAPFSSKSMNILTWK